MLHDRVMVKTGGGPGERTTRAGIVIPATAAVAKRLVWGEVAAVGQHVRSVKTGDRVLPGRVLIAPGGMHMRVKRSGGIYEVECREGEKVSGHCPSVDVLMHSVAEEAGANALGVMLTGMGSDGAEGMLAMRRKGARTVAQDERTCVVFGMPKVAFEKGGAERLLPLDAIPDAVLGCLEGKGGAR